MIYEEFERRIENGYYKPGDRLWGFEMHYTNIDSRITKHTPLTELELSEYHYLYKISKKTGRRLDSYIYVTRNGFREGPHPESYYQFEVFETYEDGLAGYRACVDFWKQEVELHRARINDVLDQQLLNMEEYYNKAVN